MASGNRASMSLASRYVLLATLIVIATTVMMAVASIAGVYRMASAEQAARLEAARAIVEREVSSRLRTPYSVLQTTSTRDALADPDAGIVRRALANLMADNALYLERAAVVDASGTVVAAYPAAPEGFETVARQTLSAVDPRSGGFVWRDDPGALHGHSLWAVVPVRATALTGRRFLMGSVRVGGVDTAIKQVAAAESRPTVCVVSGSGRVEFAAGDARALVAVEGALTTAPGDETLPLDLTTSEGVGYTGRYSLVPGLTGLDWRVVVLERADAPMGETRRALVPAWVAWGLAVALSFGVATVAFRWMARPFRTLESRARAAAAGALLEPVAVGRADEVGRLLESFNLLTTRLNRMHDVSQILARSSDRGEVLAGIVSSMAHMLNVRDVDVLLLDESGHTATLVQAIGELAEQEGLEFAVDDSPWLAGTIRSGDASVFSGDPADDELMSRHAGEHADCCGLAVPLTKGAEVLGVVAMVCERQRAFTAAEIEMARSFAAQTSVAFDNARLFDEERRSRLEAEALRRVAEALTSQRDIRAALDAAARIEAELLGFDTAFVALAAPERYGAGPARDEDVESRWLVEWMSEYPECVDGAQLPPLWVEVSSPPEGLGGCVSALGASAALVTPLFRGRAYAGLLVLGAGAHRSSPSRRTLDLAGTIARQAGLALENAFLFQQARDRADNLETVFRISQAVSSSLQNRVVLSRVLDVVQKIFSADAVMLMTYERDRKAIVVPMARGLLAREMLEMVFRPGDDIPGRVFDARLPERIGDLTSEDTGFAAIAAAQGLRSALIAPLLARGRSIGVLATLSKSPDAFTSDDMELMLTFAAQGALAIDTANLFSREHHVASVLQESILPTRLPRIEGLDTSSVYVPAGSEVEIGGDYYDVFRAPDGRVAIALGDVCGKGVEAATKTSMIKYAIRGMVAAGLGPARVLGELNDMIVASGDPSNIVTLWFALLDVGTGEVVWANGGHPPALLFDPKTREISRLDTTGALLGAVLGARYEEKSARMEPAGALLLFTDGVTEARNDGRFFGEGRVRRALRYGGSAAVITQRLLAMVQRFSSGDLRDDAAILTIVRAPGDDGVSPP